MRCMNNLENESVNAKTKTRKKKIRAKRAERVFAICCMIENVRDNDEDKKKIQSRQNKSMRHENIFTDEKLAPNYFRLFDAV